MGDSKQNESAKPEPQALELDETSLDQAVGGLTKTPKRNADPCDGGE